MAFGCKNSFCLGTPECFRVQKHMLIWNPRVLLGAKHMLIIKSNHLQLNKQILPNKSIRL